MKKVNADVIFDYLRTTELALRLELPDVNEYGYFESDCDDIMEQIELLHKISWFIKKMPDVS